jgi:hypothetical protein
VAPGGLAVVVVFRYDFGNLEMVRMSNETRSPVAGYRARLARRGFVRGEVTVSKDDERLVRHVAAALSDPTRQAATRVLPRQHFAEPPKVSQKALLAAAPLDGIDIGRGRDVGRDIDL